MTNSLSAMTSYHKLIQTIDELQAQGKNVKVTILPSTVRNNRKSMWVKR